MQFSTVTYTPVVVLSKRRFRLFFYCVAGSMSSGSRSLARDAEAPQPAHPAVIATGSDRHGRSLW
ncbi:MAG: hypothetical protein OXF51_10015, partial [Alphaproteobacteria bacterium]|nr:hypothetical protein [Alphaproteobacteria bacterium]